MMHSNASLRRMGHLLKQASREMRRITSKPMPILLDDPGGLPSSDSDACTDSVDHSINWCTDLPQTELSLSNELVQGMESIVTRRQRTFATLEKIPSDDARQPQKDQILKRIQDVETRAVVFLTLPPTNTGDFGGLSIVDRINSIFDRFLMDAESCLVDAEALLRGELKQKDTISHQSTSPRTSKPDIAKDLLIPGFNQHDALELDRTTNNSLFHLLSNPDLRLATSMVKVIIGSSCSQITGSDPDHCLNRLRYLLTFFAGEPVRPPGAAEEAFRLPQSMGVAFAWHCLLNSALAQAERQFAFSLPSVFPFAAILITLLAQYPDYTPHFLSRIALACPLLTLYMDDEATVFATLDLNTDMYETVDDAVLRSWCGIARLFAAVLIARPPPHFDRQRPQHLCPKLLWITVAGIARHTEKLDVTAGVLLGLLEVGGTVLIRLYRRQARRLIKSLIAAVEDSMSTPQLALLAYLEHLLDPNSVDDDALDQFWN